MTKEEKQFEALRAKHKYPGPPGLMTQEELWEEEKKVIAKKSVLTASQRRNVLHRADLIRGYDKKKKELKKEKKNDAAGIRDAQPGADVPVLSDGKIGV